MRSDSGTSGRSIRKKTIKSEKKNEDIIEEEEDENKNQFLKVKNRKLSFRKKGAKKIIRDKISIASIGEVSEKS